MKLLQRNFTTPEQSKRLLELGVPADSADCYHNRIAEKPFILSMPYSYSNWDDKDNPPLPCWSVGRLIEIVDMCSVKQNYAGKFEFAMNKSYIQNLIYLIIGMLHTKDLDFSKLED